MSLIIRTKLNYFISGIHILWNILINNFSRKGGCSNNQHICSKIRSITTQLHKHTIYITSYYNQASPQTVEGQYTFGNPCSSSAVTVGVQQTFGNDCSSLVDFQKHLQYARTHSVILNIAPQRLSKTSRSSATPNPAPQGVGVRLLQ